MVAQNTQVSPLQRHSKSSHALNSFRHYSRIQSEVKKEGFEVHKENLSSLPLSKKDEHFRAGEKHDPSTPLSLQVGHLHVHGASAKAGLPSVLRAEIVTSSHEHTMQQHEQDIVYTESKVSHDRRHPGTAEKPSSIAAFSISSALHPRFAGEEANNASKIYSKMFPRACTSMSTCTSMSACTTPSPMHQEKGFGPPNPMMAEHGGVVQFLPNALCQQQVLIGNVDGPADHVMRLKYTSIMEGTSIGLIDVQTSVQGITSYCVEDGSSMCAARDAASHASTGDMRSFNCVSKTEGCTAAMPTLQHSPNGLNTGFSLEESNGSWVSSVNAYSASGTSLAAELSKAPPAIGLKLFTMSAHAQMPKALLTFSEGEPSLPISLEHSQQQASSKMQKTPMPENSCTDADWGKFLALSATPLANHMDKASARVLPFQQRFKQLQTFLKQCDEADQNECMQALRSLSAAARSGRAVELETRAIRLSLEEGKEMKRMRLLNVLGKISEQSLDDLGATPHGPRLPAPGAISKVKNVP